ncbi:hypothetical protein OV208_20925 [Corallococcus sp. bb12-1]|uniref:hypothetical protein n=1 Tax=Corallococcus sp. bb12-1 TaxID=2996784 RepID=UPI00226DD5A5|nr:hypothetical protein [Corallococcus sp. bb12-1]MCY1043796.1 hypothetical protein [Corallococcus sp. bb12-1]
MKRSLCGLLVALAFTGCSQEAPGKIEPLQRPPGAPPAPASTGEAPAPVAAAPVIPKDAVLLRWKPTPGTPVSFRLSLTLDRGAPAFESAPAEPKADKKKKGDKEAEAPAAAAAPATVPSEYTYVLDLDRAGERHLRMTPSGGGAPEDASVSDRGFIIDGLPQRERNLATLVLELPRDPVRPGETWSLATALLTPDALGTQFRRATGGAERHNRVKLVSVTPADNGEQVATLEYDLLEQFGGLLTPARAVPNRGARPPGAQGPASDDAAARPTEGTELSATVKITGRGEFLVKAGQWRSWEGTLATSMKGPAQSAVGLPPGTYQARLAPVSATPAPAAPTATPPAP